MGRLFLFLFATMICTTAAADADSTTSRSGCDTKESHQFDFWIGTWDVASAKALDKKIADSRIEKLYAGCAVHENWMPLRPNAGGGSLNAYDPVLRKWRQFWTDSDGAIIEFAGGLRGKKMILEGSIDQAGLPPQRKRMTFTPKDDGSVEQVGETSRDGKVWMLEYDLIYRPSK
jgi:hypothetical protein